MKMTLGFSPCPNDTFIFDALVNKLIDTKGIELEYVMADVEQLNNWAAEGKLDITKISYGALFHNFDKYSLLHSGSALGAGVGPLLVSKRVIAPEDVPTATIAIPGKNTTANLLLSLAFPEGNNKTELRFDFIEDAVIEGKYDAGLIIHEGRFTYEKKGLHKIIDLGEWWEQTVGALIPLGGIAVKRTIDPAIAKTIDDLIKESLVYSWNRHPVLSDFIRNNAQEMEEDVMRKHINLYVNEYTSDLGEQGYQSINTLFQKAKDAGMLTNSNYDSIFY